MANEPTPTEADEKQEAPAGEEASSAAGHAPEAAPEQAAAAAEQPAPEAEQPAPAAEQPAPEATAQPAAEEQPAPAAEQAPAEAEQPAPPAEQPAPPAEQPAPEATAQPAAEEQPAAEATAHPTAEQQPAAEQRPAGDQQRGGKGKPRRDRPQRDRGPRQGRGGPRPQQSRATGPLPFQELRDAAAAVVDLFGARQALRDAFAALGEKERRDLSRLVAEDGDWRVRARNIAAGSLGAGRVGKALAAQQISMARVEDLWPLTLSREEAAERQSRVRSARQRDERRAKRDTEREQRSDRVSRAELEKAQDGRVGAQIRIVIGGQSRDRKRKGEDEPKEEPKKSSDVLDRLGY
jgi:hypothetical protein